jgi:NAD(P)-dependent dehydrogenase (short-subunit alcohol dehydrogenase family)
VDLNAELAGKVAIVTGAGRGLGRAYALRLADLGADVVVADVNLDSARDFSEQLTSNSVMEEVRARGRRSFGVQCDLSERHEAQRLAKETLGQFGRIDILVNNAGGATAAIENSKASVMNDEDFGLIWGINLLSTIFMCQAVAPCMSASKRGVIVNTSSMAALDPSKREGRLAHYGLAKGGVIQYTRFLAYELGPSGIRVNCIAPGTIETARIKAQAAARGIATAADLVNIPLRRLGTTDDCVGVVEFLVRDLSAYVTGQCISVCGGRILTPS